MLRVQNCVGRGILRFSPLDPFQLLLALAADTAAVAAFEARKLARRR
jgi:hypothetical protein